ncbi:MAG: S1 family peptidase [Chloroflexi bacterium]|nr:S1 family peptidase [Chloroflexota bacterium]MCC6892091.1 hypothetical protein [Anaerolineae bacterium]
MAKTQAEWKAEHDRLMTLFDQATEALKQYPGVVSVEIGIKETGGELTEVLAFRVYVERKVAESELAPSEKIPDEIFGVQTDVIPYDVPTLTFNEDKFRPLKGGIKIANDKDSGGTLGCIAQRNSDNTFVVLSNAHVLLGGYDFSETGVEVGQPHIRGACCCTCDEIGEVVAQRYDAVMDCAIASIKSGITATSFIRALGGSGSDSLTFGSNTAVVSSDLVHKVGKTSDRTSGRIITITHPTTAVASENIPARIRQILIRPDTGTTFFQEKGDSGSVLVNADNEVIGLMWGAYLNPGNPLYGHGVACPIADVLAALNIRIPVGSINTGEGPAPLLMADPQLAAEQPDRLGLIDYLQMRLAETPRGRALLHWVDQHGSEMLNLVNNDRAVTVTWHRKQGPAFVAALGRSAKVPTYVIPASIEGVSRQQLVMSMAAAFAEHGSPALRAAVDQFALPLLQILQRSDTLDDVLRELEADRSLEWTVLLETES